MNLDAGSRAYRRSMDNEMVDIDLESGQGEGSSSPRISVEEMTEPMRSPRLMSTRTPSPAEMTPRAPAQRAVLPSSVLAATTALRRPWPIPENPETATRAITTNDEWEGYKMESRSSGPGRTTRESSVMSTNSDKGLLDDQIYSHRSVSPTITMSPMDEDKSRPSMTPEGLGSATFQPEDENRDDSLDEVDLDGMEVGGGEPNGVMGKIATKNHNVLGRAGLRR